MRKIKIETWKATIPVYGDDGKTIVDTKEVDENILVAINNLVGGKKPEDMPRGIDKYRLFNRIGKAFDKAEKGGELILEDQDYDFLKKTVESDVPAAWGMNKNLFAELEKFLEAPQESPE